MIRKLLHEAAKALLVSAECVVAGFTIGTVAHFLGGAPGFGFSWEAFRFAAGEGGVPGGVVGFLIGLLIFYAILHAQASWKDWALLISVALVTATVAFMVVFVFTVVVTPIATIATAVAIEAKKGARRD